MTYRLVHSSFVAVISIAVLLALASATVAAPRITNGTKVDGAGFDARWGSIVSIRSDVPVLGSSQGTDMRRHACAGTLVEPRLVVTAASCISGLSLGHRFADQRWEVLAGTRRLGNTGPRSTAPRAIVRDVFIHPQFERSVRAYRGMPHVPSGWDVAVLRLAEPLTGVATTPLVRAGDTASWGDGAGLASGAWVAGWGSARTDIQQSPFASCCVSYPEAELREAAIPIASDTACASTDALLFAEGDNFDRRSMLCGGTPDTLRGPRKSNRVGTCYGDGGGPLVVTDPAGVTRLAGVVSWGGATGTGCNRASVFTRIDAMRPWIETVIAAVDGPALEAPIAITGTAEGIDGVRLTWTRGAGAPVRQRVYLNIPYSATSPGRRLPPNLRVARVLLPVASTDGAATQLAVRGLTPGRVGVARTHVVQIEAEDANGTTRLSAPVRVTAPVDVRPPTRPGPALLRTTKSGVPVARFLDAMDNDCVMHHTLQIRPAGAKRWRTRATFPQYPCGTATYSSRRFEWSSTPTLVPDAVPNRSADLPLGQAHSNPLKGLQPGHYSLRVQAADRAGNISTSRVTSIRIDKLIKLPARRSSGVSVRIG
ncbi:MAG: Tmprss9 [Thermoleophilia bacterium]|nr:Tmprss9 [Thermoleophilia bacterium]